MSRPFDDIETLMAGLPGPDEQAWAAAAGRPGAAGLGRLGELAAWSAAWQGRSVPQVRRPVAALYASAYEGEVDGGARARLEALAEGEGAISAAARTLGAGVEAFDLALDRPVPDAAERATMGERECAATIAFGMEALAKGPDVLVLGDMTRGSERPAEALALALFGEAAGEASDWSERAVARARAAGAMAPLDFLRELGGRETAALLGALAAARVQKVPVILDGKAALAAGAVAQALRADALDHCLAADGGDAAQARLLARLGLSPLLALGAQRPEGMAGLAALSVLRCACAAAGEGEAAGG
jgi:nicotinate-nucleotide--dimethylbenzimidazole phosphoribosyltransferase